MKIPHKFQSEIDYLLRRIQSIYAIQPIVAVLPVDLIDHIDLTLAGFDLNNLTHPEVLAAMRALAAGRWERSAGSTEGTVDYSTTINDLTIRLWSAAPPNSCRVIETEEEVPARPAYKRIKRRVVCGPEAPVDGIEITEETPAANSGQTDELPPPVHDPIPA